MLTLKTVLNITSALMELLTTIAVIMELFGTKTVSTVTGQRMWCATQVDI